MVVFAISYVQFAPIEAIWTLVGDPVRNWAKWLSRSWQYPTHMRIAVQPTTWSTTDFPTHLENYLFESIVRIVLQTRCAWSYWIWCKSNYKFWAMPSKHECHYWTHHKSHRCTCKLPTVVFEPKKCTESSPIDVCSIQFDWSINQVLMTILSRSIVTFFAMPPQQQDPNSIRNTATITEPVHSNFILVKFARSAPTTLFDFDKVNYHNSVPLLLFQTQLYSFIFKGGLK